MLGSLASWSVQAVREEWDSWDGKWRQREEEREQDRKRKKKEERIKAHRRRKALLLCSCDSRWNWFSYLQRSPTVPFLPFVLPLLRTCPEDEWSTHYPWVPLTDTRITSFQCSGTSQTLWRDRGRDRTGHTCERRRLRGARGKRNNQSSSRKISVEIRKSKQVRGKPPKWQAGGVIRVADGDVQVKAVAGEGDNRSNELVY